MSSKKYMKMLISLPESTYKVLTKNIPEGKRSNYIAELINQNLLSKKIGNMEKFWDMVDQHRKGDYSNEDCVKSTKEIWKYVD